MYGFKTSVGNIRFGRGEAAKERLRLELGIGEEWLEGDGVEGERYGEVAIRDIQS